MDRTTIDLTNLNKKSSIKFLLAELPKRRVPFVLIRYSLNGQKSKYGLRLDLEKKAFIDHLDDDLLDDELSKDAPRIVEFIVQKLQ